VRDEELTAAIEEIRARARSRSPEGPLGLEGVEAPNLMPLVHARDAAEAKVAAIGTVNPRPGGLKNSIAQSIKRFIARSLDWHIREQVEFNRGAMACVQASIEALTEVSRSIAALASHHQQLSWQQQAQAQAFQAQAEKFERESNWYRAETEQLKDIRRHWTEWRTGFEERRMASEIHLLRSLSEIQGAFQHRVTLLEESFRDLTRRQHGEFQSALDANTIEVQKRLWDDLQKIRAEYERLIYTELRTLRQKQIPANQAPVITAWPAIPQNEPIPIDWMRFAEVFRGSEERIRAHQARYVDRFAGTTGEILDIGCGRGEFLGAAAAAGLQARGIDLSAESIALCRSKGLAAEVADLFEYLGALPDRSVGGVYCSQVVEHLPPSRLPVMAQLLGKKLRPGAMAAFETPNPECLAIFATHFYIDPTHTRPVPAVLLRFYLEESGFGNVEIEYLAPAVETIPALAELPAGVRDSLFGGLDYALFARKL
jgi:2-polyprenyl-3-methyl-5-hydroxy-6-metoxy-1,4-benzoquinol methylase